MRRHLAFFVGSLLLLAGCNRSVVQQNNPQPPDPLLVTKKPVQGKPSSLTSEKPTHVDLWAPHRVDREFVNTPPRPDVTLRPPTIGLPTQSVHR